MKKHLLGIVSIAAALFVTACNTNKPVESNLSASDARIIAKDAYIYGFPMAANYATMYKQAIDTTSHDYRGPFNEVHSAKSVATPDDKFVVTPNSDTPYSYLWLDLRAEPIVVTMPKIEPHRYYTGQIVDLYTYNTAYLGTRAYGNDGGTFLLAGPDWSGEKPAGVKDVIHIETQFAYILFRTQLFNMADPPKVNKIQDQYKAQPLSAFLHQPASPAPPAVNWPRPAEIEKPSPDIFPIVDFLFQFCPPNPSETATLARFAKINIGPNQTFDLNKFSPEIQQAINDGIKDSNADFETVMTKVNTEQVSSGDIFGTRDLLKDNYLYRYAGAKLGLYGNSKTGRHLLRLLRGRQQPTPRRLKTELRASLRQRPAPNCQSLLVSHHVRRQNAASRRQSAQALPAQLHHAQELQVRPRWLSHLLPLTRQPRSRQTTQLAACTRRPLLRCSPRLPAWRHRPRRNLEETSTETRIAIKVRRLPKSGVENGSSADARLVTRVATEASSLRLPLINQ